MQLAEGHQVHVVVDEHRAAELLADRVPHREPVPARHDRRDDRHAVAEADRPGHPDARPVHLGDQALVAQLAEQVQRPLQHHGRALPDVAPLAHVPEDLQLAVGHRHVDRGGPDVEGDEPQPRRQPDDPGPPPAPRGRQPGALHEAELDEPVQFDGQLGPRQPDDVAQLGARARPLVTQQPQQACLVHVLRTSRHAHHAVPSGSGPGIL